MIYVISAVSICVGIMTMAVSYLFNATGMIPVIALAFSAFTLGFIMGENRHG